VVKVYHINNQVVKVYHINNQVLMNQFWVKKIIWAKLHLLKPIIMLLFKKKFL